MGKYNGAVVTTAGQNVIAQAITGTELTWTVMRTSSVAIPQGTDLTTLTSLSGIEQTSKITDASVYGNNVIQLSSRFSNTGIATVYYIQTVGIYGQLAGGAETLIAVMTAVTPDEMPVYDPDSPSAFIFNTQITVQNADAVTMTVNDTGTATVADLNRKVDINGGDLSDTVVDTFTASTAEYPVPASGDTMRVIGGKIAKFCADILKTFTGATASAAGAKGLVPAPAAGRNTYYLRGDGTWQAPVNDNTTTAAGKVMDARQANPKISGTIAANVKSLNDSFTDNLLEAPTYVPNSYVSSESAGRLRVYKRSHYMGIFVCNLSIDLAQLPSSSSDEYTIARLASPPGINSYVTVVSQYNDGSGSDYGSLLVGLKSNGDITIANTSGRPCFNLYRTVIPVLFV